MALFEFGDYSYQEITLKEKLLEVLSYLLRIGDFKQYAGKTILNNVYMDLRGKKPVFKRTKTAMEKPMSSIVKRKHRILPYLWQCYVRKQLLHKTFVILYRFVHCNHMWKVLLSYFKKFVLREK